MTRRAAGAFAAGAAHARFMIGTTTTRRSSRRCGRATARSARSRCCDSATAEPTATDDLELVCELARRAALAIDNARLYTDLRRVEQRLEAILRERGRGDHRHRRRRPDGVRQPGRGRAARRRAPERADERRRRAASWARFRVLDEHGTELDLARHAGPAALPRRVRSRRCSCATSCARPARSAG